MKKQGDLYLKILVIVLVCTIVLYFAFSVLTASGSSVQTVLATIYEAGDGISTTGYVVRAEELVYGGGNITILSGSEGERVSKGQTIAVAYRDADAQTRQNQLDAMNAELEQLQYAYNYASQNADNTALDSDIDALIAQSAIYTARRDMTNLSSTANQLKTYTLRRYTSQEDSTTLWKSISSLKDQIEALQKQAERDSTPIVAARSGYFSGITDGFEESLTPEMLDTMDVAAFQSIEDRKKDVAENAVGKLITSQIWYYVTTVPTEEMEHYQTGDTLTVNFAYEFYNAVDMTIERIGADEGGTCILVLSSGNFIQNATGLRRQSADIVFSTYRGLRVPKAALHVNDSGVSGVYVLEGAEAAWKSVTILHDAGDCYIVTLDKSSTRNLWPNDEIILSDEPLYDGKVVVS